MATRSDLPTNHQKLQAKVALITGGASGIGVCTARLFRLHGAKVVIADVQDELGGSVASELGEDACYIHCDVTNEDDIRKAVDCAVSKFGKLDIMFNNAGIGGEPVHNIVKTSKQDFERVLSVNLLGPFLGTKHAARVMIPARSGCIITTASLASVIGGAASYPYTCAKHGVVGLTKNASSELGMYGIRVNCISPSALVTPLATKYVGLTGEEFEAAMEEGANLKGIRLKADDVANAALYLASEDGRFISGHNLVLDGGLSAVNPSIGIFKEE
ncbi:NAD(P)-binding Rossmann-fold superfamily protein [Rhynchospora pubera]|uniref:NAD(P)-binding Rossmann-fold superfamily protein n=1 Tax=Rhynchospora pubera TaxID=906938 RepID=A0AAV8G115_9POAL|nr:NAD(P)-binding Rossmann-fold superfamily protein [Rhynchospora pubera]